MDELSDTTSTPSNLSRQLLSVVILVIAGLMVFTASNWDEWFGPEPPPQAVTDQQAHKFWSSAQQSGSGWSQAATAYEQLVDAHADNATYSYRFAYALHAGGEYGRAIEAHRRAARFPSVRGVCRYNLACALALAGRTDEALDELEALERDDIFRRLGQSANRDPDFDSIRDEPRFIALLDRLVPDRNDSEEDVSRVPSNA